MAYPTVSPANFTTVECHKQVRSWRLLRSLLELLIQTCTCTLVEKQELNNDNDLVHPYHNNPYHLSKRSSRVFPTTTATNITGTIFGSRKGKVNFCIQTSPKSQTPLLLLELTIPTTFLAREMRGGNLRIALESSNASNNFPHNEPALLAMPIWTMHCNGRKVGFAFKKQPSISDTKILKRMESIEVGAGIINAKEVERQEDIMYLRGNFKRVSGGSSMARSETFHLIDPDRNIGQELSIFFFQST